MLTKRPAPDRGHPRQTSTSARRLTRTLAGAAVAAVCLSIAPIQAGAAGNSVDPSTYVHSVCTSLGNYKNQLESLQSSSNFNDASSLTEVRDKLVAFLNQIVAPTNSAVTDLQNAGAPNIKNGNKIAALIVNEITALRDAFTKAATSAQQLNTSDQAAFQKGIDAIGKRIDTAGNKTSRVLDDAKKRFNTKALNKAKAQDPSCEGLK
jgi:hypothetical protein